MGNGFRHELTQADRKAASRPAGKSDQVPDSDRTFFLPALAQP
jgi:hypothetical protein